MTKRDHKFFKEICLKKWDILKPEFKTPRFQTRLAPLVEGSPSCKFCRRNAQYANGQQCQQSPTTPGSRTGGVRGWWLLRPLEAPRWESVLS